MHMEHAKDINWVEYTPPRLSKVLFQKEGVYQYGINRCNILIWIFPSSGYHISTRLRSRY